MKAKKYFFILVLFGAVLFNACDDNSSDPGDGEQVAGAFFMPANGNYYKYSVEATDSSGTASGTRSTTYQGTRVIGSTTYQVQVDTLIYSAFPMSVTGESYFYVTKDNGNITSVNYFLDTTGIYQYIPDEYISGISFSSNMQLISLPLKLNTAWDVFSLSLSAGALSLKIIDVTGTYTGTEKVPLNLTSGSVEKDAARIHYKMKLQIPDPSNPFNIQEYNYDAYLWLVEGIGVVKLQGSGAILSAFTGGGIDIFNTSVVTQSLIQYSVN
jgi:hypothetical protein